MNEKCFCHIGMADGTRYKVKDADARDSIESINNNIESINDDISSINTDIESINNDIRDINTDITIFVGDSYGSQENSWVDKYIEIAGLTLNTNAFNFCTGGTGFLDVNAGNNTYLQALKTRESNITNKNLVRKIICCGGYNDRAREKTALKPAVKTFIEYCKANYPNAKVYVGMIANTGVIDDTAGTIRLRNHMATQVMSAYKSCSEYGGIYLYGIENIMHYYYYFQTDQIHPNTEGSAELGKGIFQAVMGGCYHFSLDGDYLGPTINTSYTLNSAIATNTAYGLTGFIENNIFYVRPTGNIFFSNYLNIKSSDFTKEFTLATYDTTQKWFRNVNHLSGIPVKFKATLYNDTAIVILDGVVKFNTNGTVTVSLVNPNNKADWYIQRLNAIPLVQGIPLLCL